MFSPISIHFIDSEEVDSQIIIFSHCDAEELCSLSFFVVKWVEICPCHCPVKAGTDTSVIPTGEAGTGWQPELLSHFFISLLLTCSDC